MDQFSLAPDPEQQFRLYYLIPIVYIYLFTLTQNQLFFWCSVIGIIGATIRHSSEEAIWGPGYEDRRSLTQEAEIKRWGTLIFADKPPHEYSAESRREVWEEGEFQSKTQIALLVILTVFQGSLIPLYLGSFYAYYTVWESIDFLGGLIGFTLLAYTVYWIFSQIWVDASQIHYQNQFDSEFSDIINGFAETLYADGIEVNGGEYEPAEAGALTLNLSVNYDHGPKIRRDVNRVAFSLCALIERSAYPISIVDISIQTEDDFTSSFVINGEWCHDLSEGELSAQEFGQKVQDSVLTTQIKSPKPETE